MALLSDQHREIRLLYLETDTQTGEWARKAFSERGHEVIHADASKDCISLLQDQDFDAIAVEHGERSMSGMDILKKLGPPEARPPVVYVTEAIDARAAADAILGGAEEYVVKDGSGGFMDSLVAAVETVVERRRRVHLQKENEYQLRRARDRAETLLKEVNHRIANSLGLVSAMLRLQALAIAEPVAVQVLQETQRRIDAIAGVHRQLYVADEVGMIDLHDYLAHLTDELQGSLADPAHPHRIELSVERFALATDKAISLGVLVGELTTNAFKYAYPPHVSGEIRISVALKDERTARLVVEDDGIGVEASKAVQSSEATDTCRGKNCKNISAESDNHDGQSNSAPNAGGAGTGLGSKIILAMALTLNGTLKHEPSEKGTRVSLEFPIG